MGQGTHLLRPGTEHFLSIDAMDTISDSSVKEFLSPEQRNCLFGEEREVTYFLIYFFFKSFAYCSLRCTPLTPSPPACSSVAWPGQQIRQGWTVCPGTSHRSLRCRPRSATPGTRAPSWPQCAAPRARPARTACRTARPPPSAWPPPLPHSAAAPPLTPGCPGCAS